jgi:hypothetical protein
MSDESISDTIWPKPEDQEKIRQLKSVILQIDILSEMKDEVVEEIKKVNAEREKLERKYSGLIGAIDYLWSERRKIREHR